MLPFRVLLITDWSLGAPLLLDRVERALAAGPGLAVQHREPGASARVFFEHAEALAHCCERSGAPLFINGRLDVAQALEAHLHLPAHGLRVADVRPFHARWLSVAVHDEAEAAQVDGADFALVSPVFRPGSKPQDTRPPLGPEGFSRLAARLPCPAFALGGLDAGRTRALGAPGVAVVGDVFHHEDVEARVRALLTAWR